MFLPPLTPKFDAALRDVHSGKPSFRLQAAQRLGDPPSGQESSAADALAVLLADERAQIRATAVLSFARIAPEGRAKQLLNLSADPAWAVRQRAVRGLGSYPSAVAAPYLTDCLGHSQYVDVRAEALVVLAELGPESVVAALPTYLASEETELRLHAALAVKLIADHETEGGAEVLRGCIPSLAECLNDRDPGVQIEAAHALAACHDPRAVPLLVSALGDRDLAIDAALSLAELAAHTQFNHDQALARAALARQVSRKWANRHLRTACAVALAMLGDLRGVAQLRRLIRSRWNPARPFAVELIGRFRIRPLRNDLADLLEKPRGLPATLLQDALDQLPQRIAPPAQHN